MTIADLRTPVPQVVWIMLAAGVLGVLLRGVSAEMAMIGVLLVSAACYMLYLNRESGSGADFSLSVQMNSGNTVVVTSDDGDFLKAIALELYEVIELEKASNTIFNIDQKVMVDTMRGCTVHIAAMEGDIVNNVPA